MGIDAAALLKLSRAALAKRFAVHSPAATEEETVFRGENGFPFRMTAAGDATVVWTSLPFGSEPDEIGLGLRKILGDALDGHVDARGIFVLPDVSSPKAKGYDAVLDEIGEAGFWAPMVDASYVPKRLQNAAPGSFEASVRDLMAAIPPDAMAEMERAMTSGDPNAMAGLQAQMAQLLSSQPGLMEQLGQALAGLQGEGGMPGMEGFDLPPEEDAPELYEQARKQMEELERTNPELLERLRQQFADEGEGEDDEEEESAPPPPAPPRGPAKSK